MNHKKCSFFLLLAISLMAGQTAVFGQIEKRPVKVMEADKASIAEISRTADPVWKEHLKKVLETGDLKAASNAARVAKDVNGKAAAPFVFYSVSPMSENQYLPDAYPLDAQAMAPIRILTARDEYEPGSFVIYPLKDLGKVKFTLSQFRTKDGRVFPQKELDLKVVKVWHQNLNGWYSYFMDVGQKLTPELLLNDEDLIKVDAKAGQNYARLTEKNGNVHYHWITPPNVIDKRWTNIKTKDESTFASMRENFRDAATFQPVTLQNGSFKQFFLTAHTPKGQAPGIYHGSIRLTNAAGKAVGVIPVAIRVLPFDLPEPMTYYNLKKPFLVTAYNYLKEYHFLEINGGDHALAEKQLEAVLRNQVEHNQTVHFLPGLPTGRHEDFDTALAIMKKVGMRLDPIFGDAPTYSCNAFDAKFKYQWYKKNFGHTNVYFALGDEPPAGAVISWRPTFYAYQKYPGFEFFIAGGDNVLFKGGYTYGWFNDAKAPEKRKTPRRWNEIRDAYLTWYACQHIGAENPAFNRRQNGLAPYLAGYSAFCNYAHHLGTYNDTCRWLYRPMVFAYGTYDGVIDTLQWEGFREGVDDIRYATLMKTLAAEALQSKDIKIRYAGGQANQFLALMEPDKGNLDTIRQEMILHILKLKKLLTK